MDRIGIIFESVIDVYSSLILLIFLCFSQFSGAANSKSWGLPKSSPIYRTLGPNCWNTALVQAGLVSSARLVSKAEFLFWMSSKYCRKISVGAKPQTGDLGSLFWGDRGLYHSFIHLKGDLVYSKNSPYPKDQPKVQKFDDMFESHHRARALSFWKKAGGYSMQMGALTMVYYRCEPVEAQFYTREPWTQSMDLELRQIESKVTKWIVQPKQTVDVAFEATLLRLAELWTSIETQIVDSKDHQTRFVREALRFRILGLLLSDLELGRKSPRLAPLIQWAFEVQYREAHAH